MEWAQDAGLKAVRSWGLPLGVTPPPPCHAWVQQSLPHHTHRCPKEMGPHVPNVTSLCLQYVKHDPNYNYDSDEGEEQMETEDSELSEQGGQPACPLAGGWEQIQLPMSPPAEDGGHIWCPHPDPNSSWGSSPTLGNPDPLSSPHSLTAQITNESG